MMSVSKAVQDLFMNISKGSSKMNQMLVQTSCKKTQKISLGSVT